MSESAPSILEKIQDPKERNVIRALQAMVGRPPRDLTRKQALLNQLLERLREFKVNIFGIVLDSSGHVQGLVLHRLGLKALPQDIGNLTRLQVLLAAYNLLKSLPDTFGRLSSLQHLELQYNKLQSLPETFGQLSRLQTLKIYNNKLQSLPETFGQLHRLQTLDLSRNQLKSLPEPLLRLTNLKILNLGDNQLQSLPETFGQLHRLQTLDLRNNRFESLNLNLLLNLSSLKKLEIENNVTLVINVIEDDDEAKRLILSHGWLKKLVEQGNEIKKKILRLSHVVESLQRIDPMLQQWNVAAEHYFFSKQLLKLYESMSSITGKALANVVTVEYPSSLKGLGPLFKDVTEDFPVIVSSEMTVESLLLVGSLLSELETNIQRISTTWNDLETSTLEFLDKMTVGSWSIHWHEERLDLDLSKVLLKALKELGEDQALVAVLITLLIKKLVDTASKDLMHLSDEKLRHLLKDERVTLSTDVEEEKGLLEFLAMLEVHRRQVASWWRSPLEDLLAVETELGVDLVSRLAELSLENTDQGKTVPSWTMSVSEAASQLGIELTFNPRRVLLALKYYWEVLNSEKIPTCEKETMVALPTWWAWEAGSRVSITKDVGDAFSQWQDELTVLAKLREMVALDGV